MIKGGKTQCGKIVNRKKNKKDGGTVITSALDTASFLQRR